MHFLQHIKLLYLFYHSVKFLYFSMHCTLILSVIFIYNFLPSCFSMFHIMPHCHELIETNNQLKEIYKYMFARLIYLWIGFLNPPTKYLNLDVYLNYFRSILFKIPVYLKRNIFKFSIFPLIFIYAQIFQLYFLFKYCNVYYNKRMIAILSIIINCMHGNLPSV